MPPLLIDQVKRSKRFALSLAANSIEPTRLNHDEIVGHVAERDGGKIGGKTRARALTPEKRREIALKAAKAADFTDKWSDSNVNPEIPRLSEKIQG